MNFVCGNDANIILKNGAGSGPQNRSVSGKFHDDFVAFCIHLWIRIIRRESWQSNICIFCFLDGEATEVEMNTTEQNGG